jgi:molybdopterin converting factor subunit 1
MKYFIFVNNKVNNMTIRLLFFGITTDLVGKNSLTFELKNQCSVKEFKALLIAQFPNLKNINEFAIAVNEAYAQDAVILKNDDVVAIIPPVSGG